MQIIPGQAILIGEWLDGAASPLHEFFLARAGFDRLPVGARHLGDGEDLERGGDGSHSTLVAASAPRSTRTRP